MLHKWAAFNDYWPGTFISVRILQSVNKFIQKELFYSDPFYNPHYFTWEAVEIVFLITIFCMDNLLVTYAQLIIIVYEAWQRNIGYVITGVC